MFIAGVAAGHPDSPGSITQRPDLTSLGLAKAAPRAFAMAGVSHADIDVCEIYDCFTYAVIRQLEDLGFCAKGEALPYTLVTVDLAEGVRALGLWRGGSALRIGAPVRAAFEPREGAAGLAFHEHPQAAANSPPLPAEGVKELGCGASFL